LIRLTVLLLPVVRVEPIWKTKIELGSSLPVKVSVPLSRAELDEV